jgi:D-lactate dehydrogenase
MKIAFFDTHEFERESFRIANGGRHEIVFIEARLTEQTASLALGCEVACSFVNDRVDAAALATLSKLGVRLLALRSAGFNHVDLDAAATLGIPVVRVPAYSPYAVAEHAVGLVLALNRQVHRAHDRVRDWNFSLNGLVGFDLHGKSVGIIGTGRIGSVAARIFVGFGCQVLAHDINPDAQLQSLGVRYADLAQIYAQCDIVSLHVPLLPATHHLIDTAALASMKRGVMLINTSRGALVESRALIAALKTGQVGSAGLDVYEEEQGVFFQDLSGQMLQDDVLARLLTFPNVLVTAHQGFLTREALANIATTTLENVDAFMRGETLQNAVVKAPRHN